MSVVEATDALPVWAVSCQALANGSQPRYPAGEKHALLVMVRSDERGLESKTRGFLQENGWINPAITRVELLEEPFHSDDPVMLACYVGAEEFEGAIIIDQDSIPDHRRTHFGTLKVPF